MKILLRDLHNISDEKNYEVDIKDIEINDNIYLKRIIDTKGKITFFYDINDELNIEYHLEGIMICPDSYTFEDVEVPFELEDSLKVVTSENEDGFYFIDNLSIEEFVSYIVLPEVPISVEKKGETRYYSGDGWTISSEEAYNEDSKRRIDPRLEKLLEYKEED